MQPSQPLEEQPPQENPPTPVPTESFSYGDWVRFLQERIDSIETDQSTVTTRALTFAGVLVVSIGVVLGFFDIPSLTRTDLRSVASVWLLVGFVGMGIVFGVALRRYSRIMAKQPVEAPRMPQGFTSISLTVSGIFLSGMVMSLFLIRDWTSTVQTLQDQLDLSLLLLTYFVALLFVFAPWAVERIRKSASLTEKWKKQQAKVKQNPTRGRLGGAILDALCWLGALLSLWGAFQAVPASQLGLHGTLELVGAGYVALASFLLLALILSTGGELNTEHRKTNELLLQALEQSVPQTAIRQGYAAIVRSNAEQEALVSRFS